MNILALGDPHGVLPKNLDSIINKSKIEAIICVGEVFPIIRNPDGSGNADLKAGERILTKLCSYNLPITVPKGNMFMSGTGVIYFKNFIKKFKNKYPNFFYKKTGLVKIKGRKFIFFDFLYELESYTGNACRERQMKSNPYRERKLNNLLKEHKDAILVTHNPPLGVLDKAYNGKHVGSKIIFDAIKKNQPKSVLCGHIHEAKGEAKIGKTKVYNLGSHGSYKILKV